jgi:hypothetical protein
MKGVIAMWKTFFSLRSDVSHCPAKLELDAYVSMERPKGKPKRASARLDAATRKELETVRELMIRAQSDAAIVSNLVLCLLSDHELTRQEVEDYVKTLSVDKVEKMVQGAMRE